MLSSIWLVLSLLMDHLSFWGEVFTWGGGGRRARAEVLFLSAATTQDPSFFTQLNRSSINLSSFRTQAEPTSGDLQVQQDVCVCPWSFLVKIHHSVTRCPQKGSWLPNLGGTPGRPLVRSVGGRFPPTCGEWWSDPVQEESLGQLSLS